MTDCIFCKIINREMGSEIVFESDNVIVIKDINPKARVHLLIIPKKHIESVKDLQDQDRMLAGELVLTAKKIGEEKNLEGYTLKFHVGRTAGQVVDHIHLHLLSD
jgi:histidine triad (HIT) family protein